MTITVGADPEIFLINPNGKFISSVGRVGGSKDKPLAIGHGCAVQEDNVAAEFNIPPASDADSFSKSIQYALDYLTQKAAQQGLAISITASQSFDDDQLMDRAARAFGCSVDYNAWTGKENESPRSDDPNLRSCGGHVHIGCKSNPVQLARWCDVKLGLRAVLEDTLEGSAKRQELYGKAGAFRPKPYGMEYRVLSPYWLKDSKTMKQIFWRANMAAKMVREGNELNKSDGVAIQEAINSSNKLLARKLLMKYNV